MTTGAWVGIIVGGVILLTMIGFFLWGWLTGQYRNIEEPKYTMLEERKPEPWGEEDKEGDQEGQANQADKGKADDGADSSDPFGSERK